MFLPGPKVANFGDGQRWSKALVPIWPEWMTPPRELKIFFEARNRPPKGIKKKRSIVNF